MADQNNNVDRLPDRTDPRGRGGQTPSRQAQQELRQEIAADIGIDPEGIGVRAGRDGIDVFLRSEGEEGFRDSVRDDFADEADFVERGDIDPRIDARQIAADPRIRDSRQDEVAERAREETADDLDFVERGDLNVEVGSRGVEDLAIAEPDEPEEGEVGQPVVRGPDAVEARARQELGDETDFVEPDELDIQVGELGIDEVAIAEDARDDISDRAREETAEELDFVTERDLEVELGERGVEELRILERDDDAEVRTGEFRGADAVEFRARQELADDEDFLERDDFDVQLGELGVEEAEISERGRQRATVRQFEDQFDVDLEPDDVVIGDDDDDIRLTDDAQERLDGVRIDDLRDQLPSDDDILFPTGSQDARNVSAAIGREIETGDLGAQADIAAAAGRSVDEFDAGLIADLDPGFADELPGIEREQIEGAQADIAAREELIDDDPTAFFEGIADDPDRFVEDATRLDRRRMAGMGRRGEARDAADEVAEELAGDLEGVDASDIDVDVDPRDGDVEIDGQDPQQFAEIQQREAIAEEFDADTVIDISAGDIEIDGEEARLDDSALERESEVQQARQAQQLNQADFRGTSPLETQQQQPLDVPDITPSRPSVDVQTQQQQPLNVPDIMPSGAGGLPEPDVETPTAGGSETAVSGIDDPLSDDDPTGPVDRLRQPLDQLSESIQPGLRSAGGALGDVTATFSLAPEIERAVTGDTERTDAAFRGAGEEAASALDIPGFTSAGIGAADFTVRGPDDDDITRREAVADATLEGLSDFESAARERPAETAGRTVGALGGGFAVGTAAARGGRRISQDIDTPTVDIETPDINLRTSDFRQDQRGQLGSGRDGDAVRDGDQLMLERTVERERRPQQADDAVPEPTVAEIEQAARAFERRLESESTPTQTSTQPQAQTAAGASRPPRSVGGFEATRFDTAGGGLGAVGAAGQTDPTGEQLEASAFSAEPTDATVGVGGVFDDDLGQDDMFGTDRAVAPTTAIAGQDESQALGASTTAVEGLGVGLSETVEQGISETFDSTLSVGTTPAIDTTLSQPATQTLGEPTIGQTAFGTPAQTRSVPRRPRFEEEEELSDDFGGFEFDFDDEVFDSGIASAEDFFGNGR